MECGSPPAMQQGLLTAGPAGIPSVRYLSPVFPSLSLLRFPPRPKSVESLLHQQRPREHVSIDLLQSLPLLVFKLPQHRLMLFALLRNHRLGIRNFF